MMNRIADISLRKAALVGGLGLLFMTVFAIFAYYFVFQNLIVPGEAATTVNNIMANELLFRTGICSYIIVIILDVAVAWALYVLLNPVNKSLSLLTAWFRLVYSAIFGIALANYFRVLHLLNGADSLTVFETDQLHAKVMLSINAFDDGWAIGYVFFGLHLLGLGYLIFKSAHILFKSVYVPRILGVLLSVAGLSYLIDNFGKFLFPNTNLSMATFTGWGELLFMFWLLWRGAIGFDEKLENK